MIFNHKRIKPRLIAMNMFLFTLAIWSLFPIAFLIIKAICKEESSVLNNEFKNILLLSDTFHTAFRNSVYYAVVITIGQTLFGILMAFIFAKFKFRFREPLFYLLLLFMILPTQTMLVQIYSAADRLSLIDTFAGVVIPRLFLPIGIIFLRQYFVRVSDSVIESAKIDGASTIDCLCRILLPIGKNGVFLLVFLAFIDSYNMYEIPLIILRNSAKVPMSVLIRAVVEKYPDEIFVPAILFMIPPVLLFSTLRDNLVNGMCYSE